MPDKGKLPVDEKVKQVEQYRAEGLAEHLNEKWLTDVTGFKYDGEGKYI